MTDSTKKVPLQELVYLLDQASTASACAYIASNKSEVSAALKSLLTEREGWVLVPREPTDQIIGAAYHNCHSNFDV